MVEACQDAASASDSSSISSATTREAVRLAALNLVLSSFMKVDVDELLVSQDTSFTRFSYSAEVEGVTRVETETVLNDVLSTLDEPKVLHDVRQLPTTEFTEVLAKIHSLSSYVLPTSGSKRIPRRALGAYYTPMHLSDFIAEKTLLPRMNELIKEISTGSERSLDRFLHLKTLDPACGPGTFLLSTARLFLSQRAALQDACKSGRVACGGIVRADLTEYMDLVARGLNGVDLDEAALEIAHVSLSLTLSANGGQIKNQSLSTGLKRGDSLLSLKGMKGNLDHTSHFQEPENRLSFEWPEQFDRILGIEGPGFDFVLMNPPYERLKPNFAEFLRERLLKGDRKIHSDRFLDHKAKLAEYVNYFRKSGEYQLTNVHTIDTYRLFIERALQLTREGARIGYVVPSTILGDLSAQKVRRDLLLENSVEYVAEFPEGSSFFPGVTQSVCVMIIGRGGETRRIRADFNLGGIEEARTARGFTIHLRNIERVMQYSMGIPRVPRAGWKILDKLHHTPPMGSLGWIKNRRGELDLTMHKDFISSSEPGNRLVRGSHISRYRLLPSSRAGPEYVNTKSFLKALGASRRADDIRKSRIACQQVSNRSQRWRIKFAPISPNTILANSCNYIVLSDRCNSDTPLYLLGILNSDLMNWRFEVSNTNNHVSNRELSSLPIVDTATVSNRQKDLIASLSQLVKAKIASKRDETEAIEAHVFALYGLTPQEAKRVMMYRGAETEETSAVLSALDELQ
ncbi:MAG: Eco57I restriction-modification methylase domain-containing protein [Candidatus Thorarchaeota archaeon]